MAKKLYVICERSQTVTAAFLARGWDAYSVDILPAYGDHTDRHIQADAQTIDYSDADMIIAHPPCTYLSNVATRAHSLRCTHDDKIIERTYARIDAIRFFMWCYTIPCDRIVVENPCGIMSTVYRKPDQYIDPYLFSAGADDVENFTKKRTGLWLRGLPPLVPTYHGAPPDLVKMYGKYPSGKTKCWEDQITGSDRATIRSKTFPAIAAAMADQWG